MSRFSRIPDLMANGNLVAELVTAVALVDYKQRFLYANAAFYELFDVGSPKLLGAALGDFGRAGQVLTPIAARAYTQRTAVASRGERIVTASGHVFSADVIASFSAGDRVLIEVHRVAPEGAVAPPSRLSESL